MAITPHAAARTTSAILSLSKRAWRLGVLLLKIEPATELLDTTVEMLTEEVKTLGLECDLVYSELETMANTNGAISSLLHDFDDRIWFSLETIVQETSLTMDQLETFLERNRGVQSSVSGQPQIQKRVEENKEHIATIRTEVCRYTDNLHAVLLLINTTTTHLSPGRVDEQLYRELERINAMIGVLHRSSEIQSQSNIETTLIHCARDIIEKGTAMYNSSMSPRIYTGIRENDSRSHVTEWIRSLKLLQEDTVTPHNIATDTKDDHQTNNVTTEESDDDLEADLTRASLETGAEAFDVREWNEANSLLQEAIRGLQQLSKRQRAFCDMFDLHYKLSVCAYHTQPPVDAEIALQSLIRQPAKSDEDRLRIYDATHLLSQIYIRVGKYEFAQADCEKALQARRRILGKQSEASLESLALMAHIYVLLNNRARAKSCLSMIPEKQRDATLKKVEESLGTEVEHLDFSSLLTRPTLEDTELRLERRNSGSTLGVAMEDQSFRSPSLMTRAPAPSIRQPYRQSMLQTTVRQGLHAVNRATSDAASTAPSERLEAETAPRNNHLSRKEILTRIGCQPKDRIEELVCEGDHPALVSILGKKKEIWRSKFRKHVRPERLTALHFAALFGEIDMVRRLLSSGFNINDVPYGYTTSLSPLKIAIGARQVGMVEFLIENNARPAEPESWASLAGQLMSRSWLEKTLSEADKNITLNRIVSIMRILIKRGWNINSPFEASGNTVLHQAVSFWTGSYIWDLHLRIAVTTFLCQRGANPFYRNKDGKTPYDIALASGHRDILMILDQDSKGNVAGDVSTQPVELSG